MSGPAQPQAIILRPTDSVPNSRLPALLYRGVAAADARRIEALFAGHGWSNAWRNGIYPFHHFHSTSHEALGCARGAVNVRLGGNPAWRSRSKPATSSYFRQARATSA